MEIIRPEKSPFAERVTPLYEAFAKPARGNWAPADSIIYSLIQRIQDVEVESAASDSEEESTVLKYVRTAG